MGRQARMALAGRMKEASSPQVPWMPCWLTAWLLRSSCSASARSSRGSWGSAAPSSPFLRFLGVSFVSSAQQSQIHVSCANAIQPRHKSQRPWV